jgi:urease accessory protein
MTTIASLFIIAHPGHEMSGILSGAAHPLLGGDHLLAILAAGLWAAQSGGRSRWMVPGAFLMAMALGAVCGAAGFSVPMIGLALAGSVSVFGLLLAGGRRIAVRAAAAVTFLFAAMHGLAHGAEIPASADGVAFGVGMLFSTTALLAAALGAGTFALRNRAASLRLAGAAAVVAGLCLALR